MDFPDLENPIKGLTRPAVIGIAFASVIYTVLKYYGIDLPISEKEVAYIGAAAGALFAWVYGFLHGKFIKPIQIEALYASRHLKVDLYLENGWITFRQARLLHAKLAKDEILGIPIGTDFDIDCYFSENDLKDDDDDDPPAGGSVGGNEPDKTNPPASGKAIEGTKEKAEELVLKEVETTPAPRKSKKKIREESMA